MLSRGLSRLGMSSNKLGTSTHSSRTLLNEGLASLGHSKRSLLSGDSSSALALRGGSQRTFTQCPSQNSRRFIDLDAVAGESEEEEEVAPFDPEDPSGVQRSGAAGSCGEPSTLPASTNLESRWEARGGDSAKASVDPSDDSGTTEAAAASPRQMKLMVSSRSFRGRPRRGAPADTRQGGGPPSRPPMASAPGDSAGEASPEGSLTQALPPSLLAGMGHLSFRQDGKGS